MNPQTTATDIYQCASKPPPDAQRAGQLMHLSKEWQAKAWAATPSNLGPESEIYAKARRHWRRVRAHRFADDPSIAKVMADAEELAWNAMWRAYDFSVHALQARFKSQKIYISPQHWRDWEHHRAKNIDGTKFLVTHIPRIGPSGKNIIRTEQEIANANHLTGQFPQLSLRNGIYLPDAENFENLFPKADEAYILCDIAGKVQLDGQGFETSRLGSVTIPLGLPPILTECSLSGDIKQTEHKSGPSLRPCQLGKNLDDLRIYGSAGFSTPWARERDFFPTGLTTYFDLTVSSPSSGRFLFAEQFSSVHLDLSKSGGRSYLLGKIKDLQITMGLSTADLRFENCDIETLMFYGEATFEILMTDSTIGRSWDFRDHLPRKLDIRDSYFGKTWDSPFEKAWNGLVFCVERTESSPQHCQFLSISRSRFVGEVSLKSQLIDTVDITQSVFSSNLSLPDSSIIGDFSMTNSTASSLDLSCRQSLPDDQRTIGRLNLSGTTVEQTAQFNNRIFDGTAVFDGSTFGTPPQFYGATLSQDTSFRNVRIMWQKRLQSHGKPSEIIFKEIWRRFAPELRRRTIARSIIARRKIYLSRRKGHASYYERLASVLDVSVSILAKTLTASVGLNSHEIEIVEAFDARNSYLAEVERAFRILRQKMEAIRAPALAESFGRNELRARHRRYGDREVAIWEYIFGKIYSFTTDYGASFGRPIAALSGLTLGMTFIYLWLLQSFDYLGQAARVAMTVTMRPLLHLGPSYGRNNPECSTKLDPDADAFDTIAYLTNCDEVTFKAISFAHSIAIILLLFFAIGALRRRFRIG